MQTHASLFHRTPSGEPDPRPLEISLAGRCARTGALGEELRVVVDIIAGASAGGINGTLLARALSHDLPMGQLRELWLASRGA